VALHRAQKAQLDPFRGAGKPEMQAEGRDDVSV
jgi:hypothetical protein